MSSLLLNFGLHSKIFFLDELIKNNKNKYNYAYNILSKVFDDTNLLE